MVDAISGDVALLCFESLQLVASVAHCPRDHFVCGRVNDKAALSLSDLWRVLRFGWYKVVTSEISMTQGLEPSTEYSSIGPVHHRRNADAPI
jgi:hypothetical protein